MNDDGSGDVDAVSMCADVQASERVGLDALPTEPPKRSRHLIRQEQSDWPGALGRSAARWLAEMPKCCDARGYVYLVEAAGLVKIGQSYELVRRMVGLQAMCPVQLSIIAVGRGDRFESMLHGEFSGSRVHGEWFNARTVRSWVNRTPKDRCISCSYRAPVHW